MLEDHLFLYNNISNVVILYNNMFGWSVIFRIFIFARVVILS